MKKVAKKGRGRPGMDVKGTLVRLAEGQPERIDALKGPGKRAEFIRDAVEKELRRQEK
jgi:hypothetical protein